MKQIKLNKLKIGIIGGGQLGRMLALKAKEWNVSASIMAPSNSASARAVCDHFEQGSIYSQEAILSFAQDLNHITIESDHVNVQALELLEQQGKIVIPSSQTLRVIQDKGQQRQFYADHKLPSPRFECFASPQELAQSQWNAPFIVKTRTAGYDGKGVFIIHDQNTIAQLPNIPIVAEESIDIVKEFSIIVVRNQAGDIATYPVSELAVHPDTFMLDYMVSPANIEDSIANKAQTIARDLATSLKVVGLLAIELFLDRNDQLWINESSARPHNSGHYTIEGAVTSQYEQHLRAIFDLPLGDCRSTGISGMINLLGAPDAQGQPLYCGLEDCLEYPDVHVHIYGKAEVSPHRKMGHITVLRDSYMQLQETIQTLKKKVSVQS